MIQTVYVLEILHPGGVVRGHFAQTQGAAQRAAAGKYRLAGRWEPAQDEQVIRIPDDQLCIVIPLTPWIERRKSIVMRKSLIIDNYLTGIRIRARLIGPDGEELARVVREQLEYG